MKLLIADDDAIFRRLLQATLSKLGYEVMVANDGIEAWRILTQENGPKLAILDWMMPGMDGLEICRKVRAANLHTPAYLILLTARNAGEDIVSGLDSGADDYLIKPFNQEELRARVQGARRVLDLQGRLAERVAQLEDALANVKRLQGLVPICMYCKKIRNDRNYWEQVESYISQHTEAEFSHGVCPDCYEKHVVPQLGKKKSQTQ
jgi:phosphoserine phosphatase RsbU/P